MPTIVISPYDVLNFSEGGGHFWVYMQYAQGLRQAGCEVYWLERIHRNGDKAAEASKLISHFDLLKRFGFGGKAILYADGAADPQPEYIGMDRAAAEAVIAGADMLLNFHYAIAPPMLARFRRTALVDIDPGLLQFWISRGQLSVPPHDFHFTTGETVGTRAAKFPDCGLKWIRIRPPVCLELWPRHFDPRAEAFSTVSNWDANDWIVDKHETYENTKRVAFLEFADLPHLTKQPLELALFLRTGRDMSDRRELERRGWRVRPSYEVASTPENYQAYIQQSRGEFSCAKRSCLKFQNAWISDRTLCYLASGKPAVVQDTGPSSFLPNREGLFRFSTLRAAAEAFEKINQDYEYHSRAARRIAETFFDANQVTKTILDHTLNAAH